MLWRWLKQQFRIPNTSILCPRESTEASSSDEGMPQKFDTPSEADIMAEFPRDMITPEVRLNISDTLEHIEA